MALIGLKRPFHSILFLGNFAIPILMSFPRLYGKGIFYLLIDVHKPELTWLPAHPDNEVDQIRLIRVGGIAADGVHTCADVVSFSVEFHIAAVGTVLLNVLLELPTSMAHEIL